MTMYWVHATCQMFLFLCFDTPDFPQGRNDCSHITNEESKKKVSCFLMLHSKWPNLDFVVQGQVFLHYAGLLCFMTYCLKAFCKPWSTIWRVLSMVVIIVSQQASSWICAPHCSLTLLTWLSTSASFHRHLPFSLILQCLHILLPFWYSRDLTAVTLTKHNHKQLCSLCIYLYDLLTLGHLNLLLSPVELPNCWISLETIRRCWLSPLLFRWAHVHVVSHF